jgi:hypothetical protein
MFGSDSFLDVVSNIVGILIILLVLVGVRVRTAPRTQAIASAESSLRDQLCRGQEEIAALQQQREQLATAAVRVEHSTATGKQSHQAVQSARAEAGQTMRESEQRLTAVRRDVNVQQAVLAEARERLVGLAEELSGLEQRPVPQRPLVLRTPLSEAVDGDELHFECADGRVCFVDLEALLQRAKVRGQALDAPLRDAGQASTSVGPVGSFRFEFTMAREDMPFSQKMIYGSGSFRARMVSWRLIPVAASRGEPLAEARRPDSAYQRCLARARPGHTALTFWVYPDSFALFRELRAPLADRGFVVAARPLPPGVPITGSIHGSRSFGQ